MFIIYFKENINLFIKQWYNLYIIKLIFGYLILMNKREF